MNFTSAIGSDGKNVHSADLRKRLSQLLETTQQADRPWLAWPTTWKGLQESDDHLLLREYLTSPLIHKEKLEEVCLQSMECADPPGTAVCEKSKEATKQLS